VTENPRPVLLAVCVFLIFISACATSPIAKHYRLEAKADNLPFPVALQNPDAHIGNTVVWGGTIIKTNNLKKGSRIVVLETPLGYETRPIESRFSKGRFIAESSNFLDPELYKKGREITVAGVIAGKKILPIGDTRYTYPVILIKQIYLWEEELEQPQYLYAHPYGYWGWSDYHGRFK
jgi:outer membrane lipoprotein